MADEQYFEDLSPVIRLRVWVFGQMVWGAFLAGAGIVALIGVYLVLLGISCLLPQQSKEAPSPYGALEIIRPVTDFT